MIKRFTALLLTALLAAGCAASPAETVSSDAESSSSEAASSALEEEEYIPEYKYHDPDPDMVMITSPDGDITYRDYRLYLDVGEAMSRYNARQTLSICYLLERDLKDMGVEISEEDYKQYADEQLAATLLYSPSISEDIKTIAEAAEMTEQQANDAMKLSYRAQYLVNLLGDEFQRRAEAEYVAPETDENAVEGETAEEAAERREQEKTTAIYEKAMADMNEYSVSYDTRLDFSKEGILATLDGEDIPLTEEYERFIDYSAMAARVDAISFIQAGELSIRALEGREAELDTESILADLANQVRIMRASDEYLAQLSGFCEPFGATCDDYFKALERPILLQSAGDLLYADLMKEYETLSADNTAEGEIAATADEHYVNFITEKVNASKVVNISGK